MQFSQRPHFFVLPLLKRMYSSMFRLGPIKGEGDKQNDVILCSSKEKLQSYIVFFGGDVQDYREIMMGHRDNHRYQEWNLESTAQILQEKYPSSDVIVVKPALMRFKTFSVYSNFVDSGMIGVPMNTKCQGSWQHLCKLLRNSLSAPVLTDASSSETSANDATKDIVNVDEKMRLPKHIIGFSKGCVVLNQLLYELESALTEPSSCEFVRSVTSMTWLDGGHSGYGDAVPTWVHDRAVLCHLRDTQIRIRAHVTPYQVQDPSRPWIGKEHKKFIETLRSLDIDVSNVLHFDDEPGSLENHFELIRRHENS